MTNYSPVFKENFHMSVGCFNSLFERVEGILESTINLRPDKIPPKEKLAMVLEYVISFLFHVSFTFI